MPVSPSLARPSPALTMQEKKENQDFVGQLPELGPVSPMNRSDSFDKISEKNDKEEDVEAIVQEAGDVHIEKASDVAVQVISARDDPELPVFTFRAIFLGIGLSAFTSVRPRTPVRYEHR